MFRDALLVPRSAPHRAVTELLELGLSAEIGASEGEIRRIADRFGVEEPLLQQALGRLTVPV